MGGEVCEGMWVVRCSMSFFSFSFLGSVAILFLLCREEEEGNDRQG